LSDIIDLSKDLRAGDTVVRQHRGKHVLFGANGIHPLPGLLLEALLRLHGLGRNVSQPLGLRACCVHSLPQGGRPTDAKCRRAGYQNGRNQNERVAPLHDQLS
jgi:hypothetical protein